MKIECKHSLQCQPPFQPSFHIIGIPGFESHPSNSKGEVVKNGGYRFAVEILLGIWPKNMLFESV